MIPPQLSLLLGEAEDTPELSETGISSGSPLEALKWGTMGIFGFLLSVAEATVL